MSSQGTARGGDHVWQTTNESDRSYTHRDRSGRRDVLGRHEGGWTEADIATRPREDSIRDLDGRNDMFHDRNARSWQENATYSSRGNSRDTQRSRGGGNRSLKYPARGDYSNGRRSYDRHGRYRERKEQYGSGAARKNAVDTTQVEEMASSRRTSREHHYSDTDQGPESLRRRSAARIGDSRAPATSNNDRSQAYDKGNAERRQTSQYSGESVDGIRVRHSRIAAEMYPQSVKTLGSKSRDSHGGRYQDHKHLGDTRHDRNEDKYWGRDSFDSRGRDQRQDSQGSRHPGYSGSNVANRPRERSHDRLQAYDHAQGATSKNTFDSRDWNSDRDRRSKRYRTEEDEGAPETRKRRHSGDIRACAVQAHDRKHANNGNARKFVRNSPQDSSGISKTKLTATVKSFEDEDAYLSSSDSEREGIGAIPPRMVNEISLLGQSVKSDLIQDAESTRSKSAQMNQALESCSPTHENAPCPGIRSPTTAMPHIAQMTFADGSGGDVSASSGIAERLTRQSKMVGQENQGEQVGDIAVLNGASGHASELDHQRLLYPSKATANGFKENHVGVDSGVKGDSEKDAVRDQALPRHLLGQGPDFQVASGGKGAASLKFAADKEDDAQRLRQRQKQIDFGKNTRSYDLYIKAVPIRNRRKGDPITPDITLKISKRRFDGKVRSWRRQLHAWDDHPIVDPASGAKPASLPGSGENNVVVKDSRDSKDTDAPLQTVSTLAVRADADLKTTDAQSDPTSAPDEIDSPAVTTRSRGGGSNGSGPLLEEDRTRSSGNQPSISNMAYLNRAIYADDADEELRTTQDSFVPEDNTSRKRDRAGKSLWSTASMDCGSDEDSKPDGEDVDKSKRRVRGKVWRDLPKGISTNEVHYLAPLQDSNYENAEWNGNGGATAGIEDDKTLTVNTGNTTRANHSEGRDGDHDCTDDGLVEERDSSSGITTWGSGYLSGPPTRVGEDTSHVKSKTSDKSCTKIELDTEDKHGVSVGATGSESCQNDASTQSQHSGRVGDNGQSVAVHVDDDFSDDDLL